MPSRRLPVRNLTPRTPRWSVTSPPPTVAGWPSREGSHAIDHLPPPPSRSRDPGSRHRPDLGHRRRRVAGLGRVRSPAPSGAAARPARHRPRPSAPLSTWLAQHWSTLSAVSPDDRPRPRRLTSGPHAGQPPRPASRSATPTTRSVSSSQPGSRLQIDAVRSVPGVTYVEGNQPIDMFLVDVQHGHPRLRGPGDPHGGERHGPRRLRRQRGRHRLGRRPDPPVPPERRRHLGRRQEPQDGVRPARAAPLPARRRRQPQHRPARRRRSRHARLRHRRRARRHPVRRHEDARGGPGRRASSA